ncbi:MAG: sodium:proton antiporter [Pseudomonadota bacterium]
MVKQQDASGRSLWIRRATTLGLSLLLALLPLVVAVAADGGHGADGGHAGEEGHHGAPHFDTQALTLLWGVPFMGILLSIAVFPLIAPLFWHRYFGRVALFWALLTIVPFALVFGFDVTLYEVLHIALLEYLPFIILLFSLFTVAGGVRLRGSLAGTPLVNTGMLLLGTVLASWMGTTGAAMLLIRPMLRANSWRQHKVHVFVFFIFLVANVGGSLTPLGDPPLFLGFLKGVEFFWPTVNLLLPMLLVAIPLLIIFFVFDSIMFRREDKSQAPAKPDSSDPEEKLGLEGGINLLLLVGVIGAVLMSGVWTPNVTLDVYHVPVELQNLVRDCLLIAVAVLSLILTRNESRKANSFTWFPIIEVAKLFAGIFITIFPVIAMLKAGEAGALGVIVNLVSDGDQPNNIMYFWVTGILSSFLDNAPTYLVFFNTAGGDATSLMGPLEATLLAISCGAVFMGANTYIGNAPNFMVRSICEDQGVAMPSFFGYIAWSAVFLLPLFVVVTLVFFI